MTDSLIYQMLLAMYQQIRDQQVTSDESILVAHALHRAMCETSPEFDAAYDRHYKAFLSGPIGQQNAAKIRQLDELIEELQKLSQKV